MDPSTVEAIPFTAPTPLEGHFTLAPEDNVFESLVIDLTHRCNMTCANCYLPNRTIPDLNVDRLYDMLARLPRRTYIRLIGAEPTLRTDLPEIIRQVIRLGHKPSLTTNGLKLGRLDYCRDLKDAGLRYVLISMNGADDDDVYRRLDNGKYATLKTRALTNAFRCGFMTDTGSIIAKGINERTIRRQIETVVSCAQKAGIDFCRSLPWARISPVLRIKSIGRIGRFMEGRSYGLSELTALAMDAADIGPDHAPSTSIASGLNYIRLKDDGPTNSTLLPVQTPLGRIFIRVIDWSIDDGGVPDPGNRHRGRLTKDFRIAPFFEDIKANEFGY